MQRRWRTAGTILALALAAGGCGQAPAERVEGRNTATSSPRDAAPPLSAQPSAAYAACVTAAGGADPALADCAGAEIERVQAALAERWRASGAAPDRIAAAQTAFIDALPLRASVDATGGTLDRMLAVRRAMTLAAARAHLLSGGALPSSGAPAPLADDARKAWAASRDAACTLSPVADCARRYDALLTVKEPAMPASTAAAAPAGLPLPDCAEVERSGLSGAALADAFDKRYPAELNDETRVETLALDDAQLGNVVGYLVCVAGRTDGDVGVAETGYTLFGSKRHGAAAFAALERLAAGGGTQAAAARAYAVQMHGYVER